MTRLVVKNDHQRHMYHNEIGLWAQNIDKILGSFVNAIGIVEVAIYRKENILLDFL
jgi:hypothetical protein